MNLQSVDGQVHGVRNLTTGLAVEDAEVERDDAFEVLCGVKLLPRRSLYDTWQRIERLERSQYAPRGVSTDWSKVTCLKCHVLRARLRGATT